MSASTCFRKDRWLVQINTGPEEGNIVTIRRKTRRQGACIVYCRRGRIALYVVTTATKMSTRHRVLHIKQFAVQCSTSAQQLPRCIPDLCAERWRRAPHRRQVLCAMLEESVVFRACSLCDHTPAASIFKRHKRYKRSSIWRQSLSYIYVILGYIQHISPHTITISIIKSRSHIGFANLYYRSSEGLCACEKAGSGKIVMCTRAGTPECASVCARESRPRLELSSIPERSYER